MIREMSRKRQKDCRCAKNASANTFPIAVVICRETAIYVYTDLYPRFAYRRNGRETAIYDKSDLYSRIDCGGTPPGGQQVRPYEKALIFGETVIVHI